MPTFITQPPFAEQLTTLAMPLTNDGGADFTLQRGYMVWDPTFGLSGPSANLGYSSPAVINYLYNPSTVSSDYNLADASAQASLNFPNPGDSAMLAIPLNQTAQWSLMFDRTFELWGSYGTGGVAGSGTGSYDPAVIGVQADVLAFMQFTGMEVSYNYGTNGQGGTISAPGVQAQNLSANSGIMQLVPSWAVFGSSNVQNALTFYGYINEWSVQYTHWTQYNIPQRCVISVNWTMLPNPNTTATPPSQGSAGVTLPGGGAGPGGTGVGVSTATGVAGR